jgi:DNA-binding transcriptional ArsR family regulator
MADMDVLRMIQALADPVRFEIFECVRCCGGESLYDTATGECDAGSVGAIAACDVRCKVACSESSMSKHFAVLRDAGLVETERSGRKLYARANVEAIDLLHRHFSGVSRCCAGACQEEKTHV